MEKPEPHELRGATASYSNISGLVPVGKAELLWGSVDDVALLCGMSSRVSLTPDQSRWTVPESQTHICARPALIS